ncbi:MAG: DUF354 domain-containing protein [Candidatus Heimdallarchaeaceae archaeon]
MLIWFDALTAKDPLLFDAIAKELEEEGHEIIFTCRNYDYVVSLFSLLGREVDVIGKHGGATLYGKLIAGNERIRELAKYIKEIEDKKGKKPDFHISFSSPESTRVAFGLAIPVININDSPHAKAVGKLTIPLSRYLVYSSCIKKERWYELGAIENQLQPYNGIDEVAWVKNFVPSREPLEILGLEPTDRYLVGRPEESSASYMLNLRKADDTLLDYILKEIFKVYKGKAIIFPRYEKQKHKLKETFGEKVIIPEKALDTLSLYYYSDLCITGGATMAREAAALGIPSISYFPKPLDVLEYINSIGIPLYNEYTLENAIKRGKQLILDTEKREEIKDKTKQIIASLESPVEKIKQLMK